MPENPCKKAGDLGPVTHKSHGWEALHFDRCLAFCVQVIKEQQIEENLSTNESFLSAPPQLLEACLLQHI